MLLRSFLVQGSWNFRTLLGGGFAFAILPELRRRHADDPEGLERALARHVVRFNTHPFLSTLVLGAVARLEGEGAEPDAIERLKRAAGAALGGIGDSLVWGALLPAASLLAILLWLTGAGAAAAAAALLALFNAGHLALRVWGLRAGLKCGRAVQEPVAGARLSWWTERLREAAAFGAGALVVALLAQGPAVAGAAFGAAPQGHWHAPAVLAGLGLGALLGRRAWRPCAALAAALVFGALAWGVLS